MMPVIHRRFMNGKTHRHLTLCKFCVLDLVELEDDIGYFKSSHTDLSSSN